MLSVGDRIEYNLCELKRFCDRIIDSCVFTTNANNFIAKQFDSKLESGRTHIIIELFQIDNL